MTNKVPLLRLSPMASRALRLLSERTSAHEMIERPLCTIEELEARGFVREIRRYQDWWGSRKVECREVSISDAGRAALAAERSEP